MTTMTPEARQALDTYLDQLRASLRGHRSVDAAEVEADVMEHIDGELSGESGPVTESRLRAVLEGLGSPRRWIPDGELPWWRRVTARLAHGPEDWRLAYLSFGALAVGLLLPFLLIVLLPLSFVAARAAVAAAEETGAELGARRWLVYPPLLLVYALVAICLLLWPAPTVLGVGGDLAGLTPPDRWAELGPWRTTGLRAALALGVWWIVTGAVAASRPGWVRSLFAPFSNSFRSRSGLWWALVGVIVASFAALALFYFGA
jgi:hypothetical protein